MARASSFLDLDALHDPAQKTKVTALYVSPQVRTPDQPGAEPHLRRRQRAEPHATHLLWQLGAKVTCRHCGIAVLTDKNNRLIVTHGLRRACKGAPVKKSPGLRTYFPTLLSASPAPNSAPSAIRQGHCFLLLRLNLKEEEGQDGAADFSVDFF